MGSNGFQMDQIQNGKAFEAKLEEVKPNWIEQRWSQVHSKAYQHQFGNRKTEIFKISRCKLYYFRAF